MIRIATLCVVVASVTLAAQTLPAPSPSVSVTGCVAEVQRDGSLGAKATGPQATPETAANEANNPTPTGRYQLLDATPAAGAAQPAKTTYALRGQDAEVAKHVGHRVEIAGAMLAPMASKVSAQAAATADSVRTVQVKTVKMVGTDCSPKPDAAR